MDLKQYKLSQDKTDAKTKGEKNILPPKACIHLGLKPLSNILVITLMISYYFGLRD